MIIDGRAIANDILESVRVAVEALPTPPRLTVFTCEPNFETQKFLALKKRKAEAVGIAMTVIEFDKEATVPEIVTAITIAHASSDGIIIQLPFPARLPMVEILPAIMPSHDVDVMTYEGKVEKRLPPVAGAIDAIATRYQVVWKNKQVVVVGRGRLVGIPVALYATALGAEVTVVDKATPDIASVTTTADILITGAGAKHLITPAMVKDGVIIFDAGTSEDNGELAGDVHPDVADKATLFTPVPGGIGPITVAVLLRNVLASL